MQSLRADLAPPLRGACGPRELPEVGSGPRSPLSPLQPAAASGTTLLAGAPRMLARPSRCPVQNCSAMFTTNQVLSVLPSLSFLGVWSQGPTSPWRHKKQGVGGQEAAVLTLPCSLGGRNACRQAVHPQHTQRARTGGPEQEPNTRAPRADEGPWAAGRRRAGTPVSPGDLWPSERVLQGVPCWPGTQSLTGSISFPGPTLDSQPVNTCRRCSWGWGLPPPGACSAHRP